MELCEQRAVDLREQLDRGEISCREVLESHIDRIERTNPAVNAIVTQTFDLARERADHLDRMPRSEAGLLHGLPVAHKDLTLTRDVRTTFGSPLFADHTPEVDSLIVERLHAAGAVMVGKTNTPEFGAGSHTFNEIFGATRNPWDLLRTAGGSSGGAAAALSARMVPIADGSDMGGSLRNPAAFCNVVGLRPTPGRVPTWPNDRAWATISVEGPMARNVPDLALMLAAIAGPDRRSPIAIAEPGTRFLADLDRDFAGVRIGFSADFGDWFPVDADVVSVLERCAPVFESLGCEVVNALPDFTDADHVFRTDRAVAMGQRLRELIERAPEHFKDTIKWDAARIEPLRALDIGSTEVARTELYHRMRLFLETHEFLVLPVTQVSPFPTEVEYPERVGGEPTDNYLDWMKACYYVSATRHPAISVPAGFTDAGLPVGLQIVGRYGAEFALLQLAHAFEQATGHSNLAPDVTRLEEADLDSIPTTIAARTQR